MDTPNLGPHHSSREQCKSLLILTLHFMCSSLPTPSHPSPSNLTTHCHVESHLEAESCEEDVVVAQVRAEVSSDDGGGKCRWKEENPRWILEVGPIGPGDELAVVGSRAEHGETSVLHRAGLMAVN